MYMILTFRMGKLKCKYAKSLILKMKANMNEEKN